MRKGDLQGSGLAGNGYVHCTPDFPATINSEIANDPPVRSWKSLVSMPVKTGGPLQFYMPQCADVMIVAKPPVEAVNEGIDFFFFFLDNEGFDLWKGCLVGQFLDKRLPFPVVCSLVNRLWGKREMPEISTTENGLFFFRFRDPEARDWVMDAGPWHLAGRQFILRAWKPGMDMLNIQLSSIPIWVRFYNIPLEYWTSTCLGHIASTVGIPLHLDPLTENQTKLSFARICIEVGVDCVFPKSVLLDRGNGNYSTIRIEYPWAPKCCSECKLFGHNLANCQVRKSPSCGITATNPENSKHEAVDRQDVDDVGEGLKLAPGNSTNSVHSVATIPTITHAESEIRLDAEEVDMAIEDDVPPKMQGNTFACLAQSEEEGPSVESVPNVNTDFSDTSPIIDTFRHIKRVDELDFTPVPLFKKKLKKLKKRSPVHMQDPVMGLSIFLMVKFASWNIRGLNDPLKQREVRSFVKSHALDFICLVQTRVRASNRDRIFSSLFPGWSLFHNYEHALLRRIWICGNPAKVSIDIIYSMDQAMLCHITVLDSNISFWFSVVYASNNYMDRRVLWRHLLWCDPLVGQHPWMIMGDFNTTRFNNEKSGGNMLNDTAMNDFHECLFSLELADVPFLGPLYTWMNRQAGDNFIARKLDRCLQNECSLDMFPNAFTEVLPSGLSDHCPLVTSLKVNPDPGPRKLIPFKFFNFWADHPDFIGLVKEAWSYEVYGTPMFRLTRKLKRVKAILKAFNFRSFGRLHERVVAAKEALCHAQYALLNSPSNPLLGKK